MLELLQDNVVGLIFGAISVVLGIWIKSVYAQKKADKEKYESLLQEDTLRKQRKMIVDEITPSIEEIHKVKASQAKEIEKLKKKIKDDENKFEERLEGLKQFHNEDKEEFDLRIEDLSQKHQDNLDKILESYKFRFIQLCKIHLKEDFISEEDLEQIIAFYDLYHSLGGNGQAEEYYDMIKKLPRKKDE